LPAVGLDVIGGSPGTADRREGEEMPAGEVQGEMTDGFNLVVDALKLNGVQTIYGVVGIPVTDLARVAQAKGIR